MSIEWRIEKFLKATKTPPTRFGREAAGDPRLVFDLRKGRSLGRTLSRRIESYITTKGQQHEL